MTETERAAFGMGCFWGPDALFGGREGVIRTRVGYAGGEKDDPTYRSLGKHTETVLIEYDPETISYRELLEIFWNNHDHSKNRKPQYASRIFYIDDEQKEKAERSKENHPEAATDIVKMKEFYVAEDYHQKYRLRHSDLMNRFEDMDPEEFRDSPEAAKANAAAAGYIKREELDLD